MPLACLLWRCFISEVLEVLAMTTFFTEILGKERIAFESNTDYTVKAGLSKIRSVKFACIKYVCSPACLYWEGTFAFLTFPCSLIPALFVPLFDIGMPLDYCKTFSSQTFAWWPPAILHFVWVDPARKVNEPNLKGVL